MRLWSTQENSCSVAFPSSWEEARWPKHVSHSCSVCLSTICPNNMTHQARLVCTDFIICVEACYLMHHMRTFPFISYKHNVIEGIGHVALMLLYTVTLIMRVDNPEYWGAEWFPKTGESISTVEFHNCHTWCSPQLGNFALNAGALFARIFVVYRLHVRCSAAISHDLVSVQAT